MTPYEKRLWIHQEPEAVGDVSMGVFAPAGVCETERDESICIQQASEISGEDVWHLHMQNVKLRQRTKIYRKSTSRENKSDKLI